MTSELFPTEQAREEFAGEIMSLVEGINNTATEIDAGRNMVETVELPAIDLGSYVMMTDMLEWAVNKLVNRLHEITGYAQILIERKSAEI
jgi:hypothetical protein